MKTQPVDGWKRVDTGGIEPVVDLEKRQIPVDEEDQDAADLFAGRVKNPSLIGERAGRARRSWRICINREIDRGAATCAIAGDGCTIDLSQKFIASLESRMTEDRYESLALDREQRAR